MELRPDAVIAGSLRLLRSLGQGGMGIVWAARHLRLDTDVAVKLIRPERVAANPALLTRFEREAKAAARIAHPHVVQVMDYGTIDDSVPYIVMELLQGFTLADLLGRGGRLSFATAKALVRQVGSALESAHAHGIVHRDVKPHNIFITEGSKEYPLFVKVLDFGVAKVLGEQVPDASAALTETGMVIGSPPYMSPEQLEGRKDVDLRSDLWSLGIIVYEALTGGLPFVGSSFVAVGAAVLRGTYRPASELRPDLPRSIDDWFSKALSLDPHGRFLTARDMVDAFVGLADPIDELPGRSPESRPVELATTIAAPIESHAEPANLTESHAPVAKAPPAEARPAATAMRSRATRWRRFAPIIVALLVALGGLAFGLKFLQPTASPSCPPGMVLIAGATFRMGSTEEAETPVDETPAHDETVPSLCLDISEVTVGAYARCAGCEPAPTTVEFEGLTPNGRAFDSQFCNGPDKEDHPINCIDWHQAKAYCAALGKRLPTEREWELAARGTDGRRYPWGDVPPTGQLLNACGSECSRMLTERREAAGKGPWPAMHHGDDAAPSTAVIGSYRSAATPAGALDLAGNVWEWTDDAYCPYGKKDCGDSRRVLRGGGWDTTEAADARAARRYPSAPTARGRSIGFRCAASP